MQRRDIDKKGFRFKQSFSGRVNKLLFDIPNIKVYLSNLAEYTFCTLRRHVDRNVSRS